MTDVELVQVIRYYTPTIVVCLLIVSVITHCMGVTYLNLRITRNDWWDTHRKAEFRSTVRMVHWAFIVLYLLGALTLYISLRSTS